MVVCEKFIRTGENIIPNKMLHVEHTNALINRFFDYEKNSGHFVDNEQIEFVRPEIHKLIYLNGYRCESVEDVGNLYRYIVNKIDKKQISVGFKKIKDAKVIKIVIRDNNFLLRSLGENIEKIKYKIEELLLNDYVNNN